MNYYSFLLSIVLLSKISVGIVFFFGHNLLKCVLMANKFF